MTQIIDFLKTRRSVKPRDMTGPGPTAEELETILTIGSRVPDHGKLTPWRFIVFEGEGRTRACEIVASTFARKNPQATEAEIATERERMSFAPLIIGIVSYNRAHPKVPAWEQDLSAGACAMNIVTAASALGYAANWLTGWISMDRDILDAFGLTPDERLIGLVHIGTSKQPTEDRPRPNLADIVTRF